MGSCLGCTTQIAITIASGSGEYIHAWSGKLNLRTYWRKRCRATIQVGSCYSDHRVVPGWICHISTIGISSRCHQNHAGIISITTGISEWLRVFTSARAHNDHIHVILDRPLNASNHPAGKTIAGTVHHLDCIDAGIWSYAYHTNPIPLSSDDTCHMGAMTVVAVIKWVRIAEHEIITAFIIRIQVFMSIIYTGINDCHFNPGTINAAVMHHLTVDAAHTREICVFIGCYRKYHIVHNICNPRVISHTAYSRL